MKRREFMALLGGAAAVWPLPVRAQQAGRVPTIGFLGSTTLAAESDRIAGFVKRLRELGWIEGRTVAIEYRWAEGGTERLVQLATALVQLKVDVIATSATAPVMAAKQATSTIPIVFAIAGDPVGNGLVASLARPGGNVTGLSAQITDLAGKRIEILREVVPGMRRLAILADMGSPAVALESTEAQAAARALGLNASTFEIRRVEDIGPAFDALKGGVEAVYVPPAPLVNNNRLRINTLALGARLPTMHGGREDVQAGGLLSYGPSYPDLYRRAAEFVDKILRGTKPADIPVEQPTKYELVVNLVTAKAIGLTIPETFLVRADEVIE